MNKPSRAATWRRLSFPNFTMKDLLSPAGLVVAAAYAVFFAPPVLLGIWYFTR